MPAKKHKCHRTSKRGTSLIVDLETSGPGSAGNGLNEVAILEPQSGRVSIPSLLPQPSPRPPNLVDPKSGRVSVFSLSPLSGSRPSSAARKSDS